MRISADHHAQVYVRWVVLVVVSARVLTKQCQMRALDVAQVVQIHVMDVQTHVHLIVVVGQIHQHNALDVMVCVVKAAHLPAPVIARQHAMDALHLVAKRAKAPVLVQYHQIHQILIR